MSGELIVKPSFDNSYVLSEGRDKEIKVCIGIQPSDELRKYFDKKGELNLGVDLYLVIDNSKSMYDIVDNTGAKDTGETIIVEGVKKRLVRGGICKFDIAKDAAKKIVENVRDIDRVSLIVYNDEPKIVFSNKSKEDKHEMINLIDSCRGNGYTNMALPFRLVKDLVKRNDSGKVKKVIFLTDGVPTMGSEAESIEEAKNLGDEGVTIDCLGIGKDINFSFLEKLSIKGNGRTEILKKGEDAVKIFEDLFQKSKEVIITNVALELTDISKMIRITEHYKGTPENKYLGKVKLSEKRELIFNIGQIERNQLYNYYFKVIVPDQQDYNGRLRLMAATVHYSVPGIHGNLRLSESVDVVIEVGTNRSIIKRNGEVTTGFLLAEVKRYEDEAEDSLNKRERLKVIDRIEKIINIYEKLKMADMAKAYIDILQNYKATEKINIERLNETRNSSSKAGSTGVLADLTDDEYYKNLEMVKKARKNNRVR